MARNCLRQAMSNMFNLNSLSKELRFFSSLIVMLLHQGKNQIYLLCAVDLRQKENFHLEYVIVGLEVVDPTNT